MLISIITRNFVKSNNSYGMREGNDDELGGAYYIKVIEKRLLSNWIISHVRVFMHNVSLGQSSPYGGNFVSGHVNPTHNRARYSTT